MQLGSSKWQLERIRSSSSQSESGRNFQPRGSSAAASSKVSKEAKTAKEAEAVREAETASSQKKKPRSGRIFSKILGRDDYSLFKKGKKLYNQGEYEKAREKFIQIKEEYPESSLAELSEDYLQRIEQALFEEKTPSLTKGKITRQQSPPQPPEKEKQPEPKDTLKKKAEKLLSNEFYDTDIKEIIRNLATETGINLIADDTVQGIISVQYKDKPLEEVLKIILSAGGYTFKKIDDYYLIGSADPRSPLFNYLSQTEYVKPKFLKAKELVKLISPSFASAIQVNEERNMLTITASPEMIKRIKEDIEKVDTMPKQVRLEAIVVELSSEAKKSLGIDWSGQSGKFSGSMQNLNLAFGYLDSSVPRVADQITARIHELAEKGQATLRATPHVTTMDGEEATINLGLEQYISITTGPVNYSYTTVQTIKAGISLNIIPFVSEDNTITVKIKPAEVSDFVETGSGGLPLINKRSVTTTVVVNDQETIAIGGFLKKREITKVSRVPILGYIPILNLIFSRKEKLSEDAEVLILITPKIVKTAASAAKEPLIG
ncbi:MAG: hypothetical protein K6U11_12185 [bacterium]|nr:hypothetical protein [bacterium]